MWSSRRLSILCATVLVALPLLAAPAASAAGPTTASHDRVLGYWTPERMKAAMPRDLSPVAGPALPAAKPDKGGGGGTTVTGAQWPDGKGSVYQSVGRVYFSLNSGNYICSGAVAKEAVTGRSLVLTAAHCAYDGRDGGFARNWMFIPEFDSNPTYTCSSTTHGCWVASALVVHGGFANELGFTTTATRHDWAFAVVGNGGKANEQLDGTVPSFPVQFRDYPSGTQVHAFGYPAAGKYAPGSELVYCAGGMGFDARNGNQTYRLRCDMTGGSSGGPWLTSFDGTGNTGVLSSVNSYRYTGGDSMYGPKLNAKTQATWERALTTTVNAIVN
jgi:hypothetical protein